MIDTMVPAQDRPRAVPVRLTRADVGELLTLQRAGYVTEGQKYDTVWLPPLSQTGRELAEELDDPRTVGVGLRERGRLVAAVRLRHRNDGEVELRRLVVAPDRQGDGLGSTLLRVAEAILAPGTRRLVLFTGARSADNLRLYRRHGYTETHRSAASGHELVHLAKTVRPEQQPTGPDPAGIRAGVLASNEAADQAARQQTRRAAVAGRAAPAGRYGVGSGPIRRAPAVRG